MTGPRRRGVRANKRVAAWVMTAALVIGGVSAATSAANAAEATVLSVGEASASSSSLVDSVVKTADLSKFQPGNIISDAAFFNAGTMSEAQVQSFLQSKVPTCQSGYTCLKDWYDTSRTTSADAMCGAYSGGVRERASTIIYKVAQACGINPQVLIVMLQKEQGLVNHTWPSDWRYTIAMGQGCPDTAACDTRYYGFFNQVYGAAWQLKRYGNPAGTSQYFTWFAPGNTWNVRWHPNEACGSAPVYIQNQATANLYYYTPYQPNSAAIRAGYGEGDGCSAYGNRNFYQYFTDWFGSPQRGECDQPPNSEVLPASGTYATANVVTARQTAFVECDEGSLRVDAGVRVFVSAAWRNWSWVDVKGQMLWIPTSYLSTWNPCAQPPYDEVRGASGSFEVTSGVIARQTAFVECGEGTAALPAGTVVLAAAEWANWSWINVNGQMLWVPNSYLRPYVTCTQPPYSEVRSAAGTLFATAGAVARRSAADDCVSGAVEIPVGTSVTLAAQYRDWYWVDIGGAKWWMRASALAADPCSQPPYAQVGSASGQFTTTATVKARQAPSTQCAAGAIELGAGTQVQAAAKWGDWVWVEYAEDHRWIHKDFLTADATSACVQPPYAEVRNGTGMATLRAGAVARQAPSDTCTAGSLTIASDRAVQIGATWNGWNWVAIDGAMHWVRSG